MKKSSKNLKSLKKGMDADTWLSNNLEYIVKKYPGRYVVIVDGIGLAFTDADGSPREIVKKAKARFPNTVPLFFRVPHAHEFVCALVLE